MTISEAILQLEEIRKQNGEALTFSVINKSELLEVDRIFFAQYFGFPEGAAVVAVGPPIPLNPSPRSKNYRRKHHHHHH